jgi:6-phosphogluconolactonase
MSKSNFVSPFEATTAYVGCRTTALRHARGRGIEVFGVGADGRWVHRKTMPAGDNPSFLVVDAQRRAVHCVHGDGDTVSSYQIDANGLLQANGVRHTEGVNPVHLAVSPGRRWLVVANYATGSVVTLPMEDDGSLGPLRHALTLPDTPGPHRAQQRGAHPHQVEFDPSGQWLLVPDKGGDAIHTLRLDEASGTLALVHTLKVAPMSGPRHLAFRGDGLVAWTVFELSSQVLTATFDARTGALVPVTRTPTTPDSFMGENTGAGIVLSADSRSLYVSNRGHGSVVRFAVAPDTGALSAPVWIATGGHAPRFIGAGPQDSVIVANEDADTLMRIDAGASEASQIAATGSPVCVVTTPNTTTRGTP